MKYLVNIIASRRMIVEAIDKQDAETQAAENCHNFDWEIDEWRVEKELPTEEDVASAKRHHAVDMEDF